MAIKWMNSQAVFVFLSKDNEDQIVAKYQLDIGYIRAYLSHRELESSQYINDIISSLPTLVSEIALIGGEKVLFFVDYTNYYITKVVSEKLKEADSSLIIVWYGPLVLAHYKSIMASRTVDVCVLYNPEESFYDLLTLPPKDWAGIDGVALPGKDMANSPSSHHRWTVLDHLPSPYRSKTIPLPKAGILEVYPLRRKHSLSEKVIMDGKHTFGYLAQELSYLSSKFSGTVSFASHDFFAYPESDALIQFLSEDTLNFTTGINCNIGRLNPDLMNQIIRCRCSVLSLVVEDNFDQRVIDILREGRSGGLHYRFMFNNTSIENYVSTLEFIEAILGAQLCDIDDISVEPFLRDSNPPIPRFFSLPHTSRRLDSSHQTAKLLSNHGAYTSGLYPPDFLSGYAKYVSVDNLDSLDNLNQYCDINGTLVSNLNSQELDNSWDKVVTAAFNHNLYLPQLVNVDNAGSSPQIQLKNIYSPEVQSLTQMGYCRGPEAAPGVVLALESQDDLDAFLDNAESFSTTGAFRYDYEIECVLKDSCRWKGEWTCHVTKLPRLYVGKAGELYPCSDCAQAIGKIGDPHFEITEKLHALVQSEHKSRDCLKCSVKFLCPKCTFLPNYLGKANYCETLRQNPHLSFYLDTISILKPLKKNSVHFRNLSIQDIRVSTQYVSHYLPQELQVTKTVNSHSLASFTFMFSIKSQPVLYNANTNKLLKVSEPLAIIFESLMSGVPMDRVKQLFMEQHNLTADEADTFCQQAVDRFIDAGFISRR